MNTLVKKIVNGHIPSAAKLMTRIENNSEDLSTEMKEIFFHSGNAHIIGITGSPGVGKSTIVSSLTNAYRKKGLAVGIVAVDSSSPFSGGAILGDRIRMWEHDTDIKGVFVRSMATRGSLGGMARTTMDIAYIMDAMGRDVVIIETVGVGQVELDIIKIANTSIVVLAPGMGDDIQAIKAGIMEIGDIFVINKYDREGAENTFNEVEYMLHLRMEQEGFQPELIKTIASEGVGIEELINAANSHLSYLKQNGLDAQKYGIKELLLERVKSKLEEIITDRILKNNHIDEIVNQIVKRETDPYTACDTIINNIEFNNIKQTYAEEKCRITKQ